MIPPSYFCSACKEPKTADHFFWKRTGTIQAHCKECRKAAKRAKALTNRQERICDQCGGPISLSAGPTAKRCSHDCQKAYSRNYMRDRASEERQARPVRHCAYCGTEFHRETHGKAKYCNTRCRDKARYGPRRKEQVFIRKWGMTYAQRDELLIQQDGCAICHTWDPNSKGWQIDHDHSCCPEERSCGKCIRGVLCAHCNCGIGLLGDNAKRLQQAAQYLLTGNRQ